MIRSNAAADVYIWYVQGGGSCWLKPPKCTSQTRPEDEVGGFTRRSYEPSSGAHESDGMMGFGIIQSGAEPQKLPQRVYIRTLCCRKSQKESNPHFGISWKSKCRLSIRKTHSNGCWEKFPVVRLQSSNQLPATPQRGQTQLGPAPSVPRLLIISMNNLFAQGSAPLSRPQKTSARTLGFHPPTPPASFEARPPSPRRFVQPPRSCI